jgi:hypothetical protein
MSGCCAASARMRGSLHREGFKAVVRQRKLRHAAP